MAQRARVTDVQDLINEIDHQLGVFRDDLSRMTLREKVLELAEIHHSFRSLGVSVAVSHQLSKTSAIDRIKAYLQQHVGIIISGVELDIVSGISEYARRIRQLRVEQGYRILSGASPDPDAGVDLKPDQYLLVDAGQDHDAARRWVVANRIRRMKAGSQDRILEYLRENVGQVVTTEDLAYVAKDKKEFGRRTRELRTEQGYAIATKFTGRPDLRQGEYILLSLDRVAPEHDRHIPVEAQKEVYERDNNTCRRCGWNQSRWSQADPRILELHHREHHAHGGANTAENLVTLCSRCHDDVHAGRCESP
jgi:hypothetical protein